MAVIEGEYLLLQQNEKLYLLLGSRGSYHLVSVDKRLTEEREQQLLRLYPCSDQTLRELGITFSALKVRGVAASGWEAGDELVLYVGKKKHRYVLSDDSTQEAMAQMFDGVEKFPMPKKKRKSSDWRLEKQKKKLVPIMKGIKTVLLLAALGSSAGLLLHHPAWSILGILVSVSCGVLDLVFPQYFTLLDLANGSKQKHAIGLGFPAAVPIMVQALYVFERYNYLTMEIHLWSAGLGILICIIFGLWCREFAERTGDLLALGLLLILFLSGPIGMVNGLLDFNRPAVYPVMVEDKHTSSGKSTNYYCTVTLAEGESFDLSVSKQDYSGIEVGQQITIAHHAGGLGMEYISLMEYYK